MGLKASQLCSEQDFRPWFGAYVNSFSALMLSKQNMNCSSFSPYMFVLGLSSLKRTPSQGFW